jgi:hypothetical protein
VDFTLESFFNPHLAMGASRLDVIITATAHDAAGSSGKSSTKTACSALSLLTARHTSWFR